MSKKIEQNGTKPTPQAELEPKSKTRTLHRKGVDNCLVDHVVETEEYSGFELDVMIPVKYVKKNNDQ